MLSSCVWRLRNAKEIATLMEELSALYPIPVLKEMYDSAISDAPYPFWRINMMVPNNRNDDDTM